MRGEWFHPLYSLFPKDRVELLMTDALHGACVPYHPYIDNLISMLLMFAHKVFEKQVDYEGVTLMNGFSI